MHCETSLIFSLEHLLKLESNSFQILVKVHCAVFQLTLISRGYLIFHQFFVLV